MSPSPPSPASSTAAAGSAKKTRAKVLKVMKEMGYKPNPFARGLGLDSMKIIGVICTDVADIFYAHAVSLLEDGLRKHHF